MHAFQLNDYIGPGGLVRVEVDPPVPATNEVLLRVGAIGINFPDLLMTKGQYQNKPKLPVVPGCEVAGTVISAPAGSNWKPGDRAAAFVWQGGFAEQVAVPCNHIVAIPDPMDLESAAAMVVNYHTVHFALARRGHVSPGETVLVLGAAGGIGTAAIQVAKGLGARVIAGVADVSQVATANAAGASETVVLEKGFGGVIRGMTDGRGVDAILDPLGDWLFDESIRTLAPEGRLLVVGFAAGEIPLLKINRILLRNITVVGVAFGAFLELDHELMAQQAESINAMVAAGDVHPHIGARFTFDELPDALHSLDRGAIRGKGIVTGPSTE